MSSETTCKLINRIPGLCLLISTLPGSHVQQSFSEPSLVNLISKDTHLVFSIYTSPNEKFEYNYPKYVPKSHELARIILIKPASHFQSDSEVGKMAKTWHNTISK